MKGTLFSQLLLSGMLASASAAPVLAGNAAPKAGQYEALMLAVTPDRKVEGFYSEELGEGVSRRCAFYLQGQLNDAERTQVTTWRREAYPGSIAITSDSISLTVPRGQEHPGCMSVLGPMISTGLTLSRIASKPWIGLVTVSADKAYLQKTRSGQAGNGPYIIKGDVVGVLAYEAGWAKVEFPGTDDRSHIGWIRQDQYSRLQPAGSQE
ncbi:hypothetical protein ACIPZF_01645 [Pseudomonas sp. NPDC089752]|uniref:hypothetical protein n=1 Tax=Pseudomonas sp. NPDC089752 TaxID=3364472 RepID=UPI003801C045